MQMLYAGMFAFIICLAAAFVFNQVSDSKKPVMGLTMKVDKKAQRKSLKENQLAKAARKPQETSWFLWQAPLLSPSHPTLSTV